MSSFWQYFSFPRERWDAIFGGGLPGADRHVVASATWDDLPTWDDEGTEFPDPSDDLDAYLDAVYRQASEHVVSMARRICTLGISYDGLDKREAAELDSMIVGFFCIEGLEALLQYKIEHWNGLHAVVVAELLSRARPSGGLLDIGSKGATPCHWLPRSTPGDAWAQRKRRTARVSTLYCAQARYPSPCKKSTAC